MELTYQKLKDAIKERELNLTYGGTQSNWERVFLQAAKNYLPILLKQEFIKPKEHGNTD